jgi:hypothetical protein
MKNKSIQEVCDWVMAKLVEQGTPCNNVDGLCVYANGKGEHCAVGWVMKDLGLPLESAFWSTEGSVETLIAWLEEVDLSSKLSLEEGELLSFLSKWEEVLNVLQQVHDAEHIFQDTLIPGSYLELNSLGIDTSGSDWTTWEELINKPNS